MSAVSGENDEWIPLLSGRDLKDFTPAEFKAYVRSLYLKREPKRTATKKKPKPPFKWSLTRSGKISIKVNREPKFLSPEEVDLIAKESAQPANEVWLYVLDRRKRQIMIATQEEMDKIQRDLAEIPF